jgi:hypothetical protein
MSGSSGTPDYSLFFVIVTLSVDGLELCKVTGDPLGAPAATGNGAAARQQGESPLQQRAPPGACRACRH